MIDYTGASGFDPNGVLLTDTVKVATYSLAKSDELFKKVICRTRRIDDREVEDKAVEMNGKQIKRVTTTDLHKKEIKEFEDDWKTLWTPDLKHADAHDYGILADKALTHLDNDIELQHKEEDDKEDQDEAEETEPDHDEQEIIEPVHDEQEMNEPVHDEQEMIEPV